MALVVSSPPRSAVVKPDETARQAAVVDSAIASGSVIEILHLHEVEWDRWCRVDYAIPLSRVLGWVRLRYLGSDADDKVPLSSVRPPLFSASRGPPKYGAIQGKMVYARAQKLRELLPQPGAFKLGAWVGFVTGPLRSYGHTRGFRLTLGNNTGNQRTVPIYWSDLRKSDVVCIEPDAEKFIRLRRRCFKPSFSDKLRLGWSLSLWEGETAVPMGCPSWSPWILIHGLLTQVHPPLAGYQYMRANYGVFMEVIYNLVCDLPSSKNKEYLLGLTGQRGLKEIARLFSNAFLVPDSPLRLGYTEKSHYGLYAARKLRKGEEIARSTLHYFRGSNNHPLALMSRVMRHNSKGEFLLLGPAFFANHSCRPNSTLEDAETGLLLRTLSVVSEGEQVCIEYGDLGDEIKLLCDCGKCK
jgi:hypothetical protein